MPCNPTQLQQSYTAAALTQHAHSTTHTFATVQDKVKEASQARRQAEAAALKAPDGPASQPAKRRSRRRRDAELTPEQEAEALFNPGAELDLKPAQQGPRNASAGRQAASAGSQAASAASVDAAGAPVGPATQSEPGREVQGAAAPPLEGTSRAELGGKAAGGGEQPGASSRLAAQSGAVGPPPSRSRSIRHGHEFMESAVTVQASAPAGWNVGSMPDRFARLWPVVSSWGIHSHLLCGDRLSCLDIGAEC